MRYRWFKLSLISIILLYSNLIYGDAIDTYSEDQIPAKYADSEFWRIANIGNRYDWVMKVEDTEDRIYFLEKILVEHLPTKYGGREEGWEDSPHINYSNATMLRLLEIYADLGYRSDAIRIWQLYGRCNFGL